LGGKKIETVLAKKTGTWRGEQAGVDPRAKREKKNERRGGRGSPVGLKKKINIRSGGGKRGKEGEPPTGSHLRPRLFFWGVFCLVWGGGGVFFFVVFCWGLFGGGFCFFFFFWGGGNPKKKKKKKKKNPPPPPPPPPTPPKKTPPPPPPEKESYFSLPKYGGE